MQMCIIVFANFIRTPSFTLFSIIFSFHLFHRGPQRVAYWHGYILVRDLLVYWMPSLMWLLWYPRCPLWVWKVNPFTKNELQNFPQHAGNPFIVVLWCVLELNCTKLAVTNQNIYQLGNVAPELELQPRYCNYIRVPYFTEPLFPATYF
jgi:hypothetical protein